MPVGLCYLAKWFYPDLFPDLDPEAIHSDFMTEFMNYEPEGVFAYPGP
jgi:iron complex transport system substrate-binding protein